MCSSRRKNIHHIHLHLRHLSPERGPRLVRSDRAHGDHDELHVARHRRLLLWMLRRSGNRLALESDHMVTCEQIRLVPLFTSCHP